MTMSTIKFVYDDGGRGGAGYKGKAGDCGVRALAIAARMPYQQAYDLVGAACDRERPRRNGKRSSPRNGVFVETYRKVLDGMGAKWTPTMKIGFGCTMHLSADELPAGRLIVRLSKHYCAVIDGVVHDTFDPNDREVWRTPDGAAVNAGPRCVYGYWTLPA